MKKIILVKREDGSFIPGYQRDKDLAQKMRPGEHMFTEKGSRNPRQHALLFALATCALANMPEKYDFWCDQYANNKSRAPYLFIKMLQLDCGLWSPVQHADGTIERIPDSIAWESKDDKEMQPILDLMIRLCAKFIEVSYDEMRRNYIEYL